MTRLLTITILLLTSLTSFGQTKMRTADELINKADPGWKFVKEWIDSAKNKIEILPVDTLKAKNELYKTHISIFFVFDN